MYKLELPLEHSVLEDKVSARFEKQQRKLFITIPIDY